MSLEEINKWLNNEYGVSYTKLEELHDFYFEKYCDLKKQNNKYKEVIKKIMYKIENYTTLNEPRIRKELLDILKEVE